MAKPAWALFHDDEKVVPLIRVGDVVRANENRHPHYRILALSHAMAWIRDVQYGTDHVVPIDRVHKI